MGLIKGAKKYIKKTSEIKERVEGTGDSIKEKLSDVKDSTVEQLSPAKDVAKGLSSGYKEELMDLKRIFQSKDLVFFKTDAFAVVLRKLGGLHEFLAACDNLTKKGYRIMLREDVKPPVEIPIPGLKIPFGTMYYFQHRKYIAKS